MAKIKTRIYEVIDIPVEHGMIDMISKMSEARQHHLQDNLFFHIRNEIYMETLEALNELLNKVNR